MDYKQDDTTYIKPDPAIGSPGAEDDDTYEDTGELAFPRQLQKAWLVRLPKTLYGKWNSLAPDEPIQLGVIRHWKNSNKMKLFVNHHLPIHQGVSKEYDIRTSAAKSSNTFIFSEKDLPGFNQRVKKGGAVKPDDKKDVLAASGQGGIQKHSTMNNFNRKKAIPKQTALAAAITKEVTCNPVDLEAEASSRRIDAEDKNGIIVLKGDVRQFARMVLPSNPTSGRGYQTSANFDTFKTDTGPAKTKPQQNKRARMPQNELLDALYDGFRRYKYWSMTALVQELDQPETYLRETLLMIAEQVKSGPFNNHWKLRAEQELSNIDVNNLRGESAPQREGGEAAAGASSAPGTDNDNDDNDDDDDDDDLDMEDVM